MVSHDAWFCFLMPTLDIPLGGPFGELLAPPTLVPWLKPLKFF